MLSRTQLQKTIQALELKFQLSNEAVINEYLTTYKRLLNAVETETSDKDIKNLSQKLWGCTVSVQRPHPFLSLFKHRP
jgi:hypothetical protein